MTITLSLLKIKYLSNIAQKGETFSTYNVTNSDNLSQKLKKLVVLQNSSFVIRTPNAPSLAPAGFLFFTDQFKLKKSDFKDFKNFKTDLLSLLINENAFKNLIESIYNNRAPIRKLLPELNSNDENAYHNIKLYLQLIFNKGSAFYLDNRKKPMTLMGYELINKGDSENFTPLSALRIGSASHVDTASHVNTASQGILTYQTNMKNTYEVNIKLDLKNKHPALVTNAEKRVANCHSRTEKIRKLCSHLEGCAFMKEKIYGTRPGHYKPKNREKITLGGKKKSNKYIMARNKTRTKPKLKLKPKHKVKKYTRKAKYHRKKGGMFKALFGTVKPISVKEIEDATKEILKLSLLEAEMKQVLGLLNELNLYYMLNENFMKNINQVKEKIKGKNTKIRQLNYDNLIKKMRTKLNKIILTLQIKIDSTNDSKLKNLLNSYLQYLNKFEASLNSVAPMGTDKKVEMLVKKINIYLRIVNNPDMYKQEQEQEIKKTKADGLRALIELIPLYTGFINAIGAYRTLLQMATKILDQENPQLKQQAKALAEELQSEITVENLDKIELYQRFINLGIFTKQQAIQSLKDQGIIPEKSDLTEPKPKKGGKTSNYKKKKTRKRRKKI